MSSSPEDPSSPDSEHPEVRGNMEAVLPASAATKQVVMDLAAELARTGNRIDHTTTDTAGGHEMLGRYDQTLIFDDNHDQLFISQYDEPYIAKRDGDPDERENDGLFLEINHYTELSEPEVPGGGALSQPMQLTRVIFKMTPDGVQAEKFISTFGGNTHRKTTPKPETDEDWDRVFKEYDATRRAEAANTAFERELGLTHFSEADAKWLKGVLEIAKPIEPK